MNFPSQKTVEAMGAGGEGASRDVLDMAESLTRLAELAGGLGSQRVAEEATNLAQRLTEGRFYVACIGQFKRGKSTLLNALVEDHILPTGVVPITTVPTVLRFGNTRRARIRFQGGNWTEVAPEELTQYVSEEHNPENTKGVVSVEVFVPSRLLVDGMCLVDTPGLGSVFTGNTAATQAFVPHIDAAIIVVGADPPIAGEELALVEEVGKQVRQLIVVLNKADRTSEAERRIAVPFTRNVLEKRLGRSVGTIYEVSAYERSQKSGKDWDWNAMVAALLKLVNESGRTLVRIAGERGLRRLSEELLAVALEEREALTRPIEESERRIASMRETIGEAERSLREIGYLFTAEQHRLSDLFLARRREFLEQIREETHAEVREAFGRVRRRYGPRFRREAMHAAQEVAARRVLPWLTKEQARAEEEYRKVAERFVSIGNEFLRKLAESRVPELARMPNALDSERGFRVASRFQFEGLIHIAQPASPLRYLADIFLGLFGARSVIQKDAMTFFDYLLEMNSTRVQSDVMERVQESRGQLEAEIRKLLHEVARIATSALDHARTAKAAGTAAVEAKLAGLRKAEAEIRLLLSGITDVGGANGNARG
ncbi:MAG TPA: dynamin family protein [Terriglobales bacterium]|jgi:ribosome biogenesis GTPase A/CRISPR/Cas system-associated endoribonuclease Cas2|nr:dynamin family protein [Terriglobales bacterium]